MIEENKLGICIWCKMIVALVGIVKDEPIQILFSEKGQALLPYTTIHKDCPERPKGLQA